MGHSDILIAICASHEWCEASPTSSLNITDQLYEQTKKCCTDLGRHGELVITEYLVRTILTDQIENRVLASGSPAARFLKKMLMQSTEIQVPYIDVTKKRKMHRFLCYKNRSSRVITGVAVIINNSAACTIDESEFQCVMVQLQLLPCKW